ncbi:MAG: Mur ligase family protein [Cyanobacteria bacterium P01_G01_bin.49]
MDQYIDKFDPSYLVTLDEIYHFHWVTQKKQRIAFLKDIIQYCWPKGHPTQLISVTGTNGKGSVAYYLEQGLQLVSRSGSWTGPHVFDYAERFHINGQQVAHHDIVAAYQEIQRIYQKFLRENNQNIALNFLEMGILITLHLFQKYDVKWGIMEVGCGGRYTPLMALDMVACVLTNVGNDHLQILGTELWQRAMDKAGIARQGVPFFTAEMDAALPYVIKTAEAQEANVVLLGQTLVEKIRAIQPDAPDFKLRNLALASQVIQYFYPDCQVSALLNCMKSRLRGRFEKVAPNVIFDLAHNQDKITRLAEELSCTYPNQQFCFLIGLTGNRDVRQVFAPILKLAKRIVITRAAYGSQDPELLAQQLQFDFPNVLMENNPQNAYQQELNRLEKDEILIVTGSAYAIDQGMNPNPYIRHLNAIYGWRDRNMS